MEKERNKDNHIYVVVPRTMNGLEVCKWLKEKVTLGKEPSLSLAAAKILHKAWKNEKDKPF